MRLSNAEERAADSLRQLVGVGRVRDFDTATSMGHAQSSAMGVGYWCQSRVYGASAMSILSYAAILPYVFRLLQCLRRWRDAMK